MSLSKKVYLNEELYSICIFVNHNIWLLETFDIWYSNGDRLELIKIHFPITLAKLFKNIGLKVMNHNLKYQGHQLPLFPLLYIFIQVRRHWWANLLPDMRCLSWSTYLIFCMLRTSFDICCCAKIHKWP